ncbi:YitT family protein [Lacticaseibacillus parakribbianus]|uniref:YitT family protein n=1 Tax=Lacticaseibacillus parakribbianus TaxID=2970927 RepID=UPI0021CB7020|nr:YitT family protein [Lacticaseibacillus parakribbianus]
MSKYLNRWWVRGALMILALELIAIAINLFYAPHGVAPGGATGIAILVQEGFGVSVGLTTLVVNLAMLVLAWFFLDRATTRRILFGSLALPVLLALTPQALVVKDRLLAVIVGSVIFAIGVAVNYRLNASSGGTTVPPMILQKYFKMKPAVGLFLVDMVVCLFNIPVSGFEAFVLAMFAVGLTSLVMNYVETGLDRKKAVYVMSNTALPQLEAALAVSDHGLTIHQVIGGHSGEPREMLMVVVEQSDYQQLLDRIHQLDPHAFVLVTEATEVHGGSLT